MKTSVATQEQARQRQWYVVDAEGKILGRLATRIADVLRGKHKATFTPHLDTGDHVIVLNVGKVKVTGTKEIQKRYHRHSHYPGHLKSPLLADLRKKRPFALLREAVSGMLPKNKLRPLFLAKLHLYERDEHEHEAQKPVALPFNI